MGEQGRADLVPGDDVKAPAEELDHAVGDLVPQRDRGAVDDLPGWRISLVGSGVVEKGLTETAWVSSSV